MKKIFFYWLLALPSLAVGQKDNADCAGAGYSFFTRIEGYYISGCEESEFKEHGFWIKSEKILKQGRFKKVWFEKETGSIRKVSGLQILTNHANAIKKIGGQVLEGTNNIFRASYQGKEIWFELSPSGNAPDEGAWYILSIEIELMKQEVTAVDINAAITSDGKIALYGILFDTGKTDIKPASSAVLKEVGAYLKSNPTVSIFIVGHTDNVGDYQMNLKLSKARAEAIKTELVTMHGIDAGRLFAEGVGPLSPVGSNESENGRAINRRVEIVRK